MSNNPWPYFTMEELSCRCGCGLMKMDNEFMRKVVALRIRVGFVLPVTSADRCPVHNNNISSTGLTGPHTTHRSIDLGVRGKRANEVLKVVYEMGCFTGIGVNQKGAARFIHLDDLPEKPGRPRPWIWSY